MANKPIPQSKAAISWATYDLANTLYSAAIVTVFLPLYVTSLTQWNVLLGAAATFAMILSGILSPAIGFVTDETGKTKRYLIFSTLTTCFATICMIVSTHIVWVLGCFVIAHFFFLLSLVYYNSLLPTVAKPENQGRISGLGTGLGYAGVLFILPLGYWIEKTFSTQFVFPAIGIAYCLASLPLFLFVPERTVENPKPFLWKNVGAKIIHVLGTLLELPKHRKMFFFLLAHFFILEAVNAIILWLSVFIKFTFGLEQSVLILVLLGSNFCACIFGFVLGFWTDRYGAYRILWLSISCLMICLVLLAISSGPYLALFGIIILGSLGFAGIWTSGRRYLISISPPEKIGEFFGLYGMTTKLSCFSMALFALIADAFSFRWAIVELIGMLLIGFFFLWKAESKELGVKS